MSNRIMAWLQSVQDWKMRFEKLFGANELESRAFKKEELRRTQEILSAKFKNLNNEERLSRKSVRQDVRDLKKELYPHPLSRLFVNASEWVKKLITEKSSNSLDSNSLKTAYENLDKMGYGNLKSEVAEKLKSGLREFDLKIFALSKSGTIINNTLNFSINENKIELMEIVSKCEGDHAKKPISIKQNSEFLTTDQIASLSKGKVIKVNDAWQMLDFNDRDKDGNVPLKKMVIPEFDILEKLKELPLKKFSEQQKREITTALEKGEKVNVNFISQGQKKEYFLEVNPLLRKIDIYDGDKKVSITDLSIREKPALKIAQPKQKTANRKAL